MIAIFNAKVNQNYLVILNRTSQGQGHTEKLYLKSKREVPRDVQNSKVRRQTSLREIGLDIRTHASPKVGQDQVSGGVSILCWHAAPVAYVQWKPCTIR